MTFKRSNLEQQVSKVPKELKWCKRCVVSNQRPRIIFNDEGICSGCLNSDYKNFEVDWDDAVIQMASVYADSHYIGVAPPSPARSDAKANYFDGKIDEFLELCLIQREIVLTWL